MEKSFYGRNVFLDELPYINNNTPNNIWVKFTTDIGIHVQTFQKNILHYVIVCMHVSKSSTGVVYILNIASTVDVSLNFMYHLYPTLQM